MEVVAEEVQVCRLPLEVQVAGTLALIFVYQLVFAFLPQLLPAMVQEELMSHPAPAEQEQVEEVMEVMVGHWDKQVKMEQAQRQVQVAHPVKLLEGAAVILLLILVLDKALG
jgi:hypothetical protein